MEMHELVRRQSLPGAPEEVFPFFADARNLEAITPPWLRFRVLEAPEAVGRGALIRYRLRLHGVPVRWLTRIEEWRPSRRFCDLQLRGPYRYWRHVHEFEPDGNGGTLMTDTVRYAMRAGKLGELAHRSFVERDLERIFDHRREQISRSLGAAPTP
ncbi:MAG: CDP-paratose 2-epimerase [Solirubrobacterales bacterium]|nr:CDP-paratose 2-epimerase [Solirubrobacterales bacterium]